MGYGPAFYITADQVTQLNAELDKISIDDVKRIYDGKKMTEAGIYPVIWEEPDALEYIVNQSNWVGYGKSENHQLHLNK